MENLDDKGVTVKNAGETQKSKVDLFTGQHTTVIIVASLFIIVFIGLIIVVVAKDNIDNNVIIQGLFSLLSLLTGFFAGSQLSKGNGSQQ